MVINFSKMHGLGNDFVVIDAINQAINFNPAQIRKLADRHFGVGCDQLLLVEKSMQANADFRYRIFNADGSEVGQCGNGARCFARFVYDKKLTSKNQIVVDTQAGQLVLNIDAEGLVTVNMGIPRHQPAQIPLSISAEELLYHLNWENQEIQFAALSIGNPHAVIRVDQVATAPVERLGAAMECHPLFPERANIGFMEVVNRHAIKLRVYERGAGETLACGSGACAAVIAGIEQNLLDQQVSVSLPGGELQINWLGRGQPVMMTGPAVLVYEGQIDI